MMSDEEVLLKELYDRLKKKEELIEWLTPRLERAKAEAETIRRCIALFIGEERWKRFVKEQESSDMSEGLLDD